MKRFFSHGAKRIVPLLLLCAVLAAAITYQMGLYEISFIDRSDNYPGQDQSGTDTPTKPIFTDGAVENTKAPMVSDSVIDSLNGSSNVSGETGEGDGEGEGGGAKYETFSPIGEFEGTDYSISHLDYSESSVLVQISLADSALPEALYGENKIYVEFTSATDTVDGIPYSVRRFNSTTPMAVELYMGYIIIDNGAMCRLYSESGQMLGIFERMSVVPAYTRDLEGNPLFYMVTEGTEKYFRFDRTELMFVEANYNDETDNRGLYFDYTVDYGTSDNEYNRYSTIVNCIVEMTHEQAGPHTQKETAPPSTDAPATDDTTSADTTTGDTTSDAPSTDAPSTDAPSTDAPATDAPSTDDTTSADTTTGDTTTENNEAEEQGGGDIPAALGRESRTEILLSTDSITAFLASSNTMSSTVIKYSNFTLSEDGKTVFVEVMERRWAFGTSDYMSSEEYQNAPDEKLLSKHYKYYHLYNFTDGLCAAVDRKGALSFRDVNDKAVIFRDGEYYGQNDRKLITRYTEPLLLGIDSIGSYYFDNGLVRIRQIDIDSQFTDKLSGDYTYLVDKNGTKFSIPSGYELIAYSDGVLLLEKDGFYGYYNKDGRWIAQPIYTYARPFAEGLGVIGFSGAEKGVIDTEGNLLVPFKYEHISQVSSGIIALYDSEEGWTLVAKLNKTEVTDNTENN